MASSSRAMLYIFFNVAVAVSIVFVNKAIFVVYAFNFPIALTLLHLVFTAFGLRVLASMRFFEVKKIAVKDVIDLAAAYVGYVVLGNLSLKVNTVGFYQITKIMISPVVMVIEVFMTRTLPDKRILMAVALLSAGIAVATVTDDQVMSNLPGMLIGFAAVLATAMYNVWAGSKQKLLSAGSSQLVHQFSPSAALMLGVLVPLLEPTGIGSAQPGTIMAYDWSLPAVSVILLSAMLGLLVALSTFLVIGSTSALTYNVMGHMKTMFILVGGVVVYGDQMPLKKVMGLLVAAAGIAWYSQIKMQPKAIRSQSTMLVDSASERGESRRQSMRGADENRVLQPLLDSNAPPTLDFAISTKKSSW